MAALLSLSVPPRTHDDVAVVVPAAFHHPRKSNGRWPLMMSASIVWAIRVPPEGSSFVQVCSGYGLLASPGVHRRLPISPVERFDVVIDFVTSSRK